jgi:hypothetical protein
MSRGGSTLFVVLLAIIGVFVVTMVLVRLALNLLIPTARGDAADGPISSAITAFLQTFDPGFMAGDLPSSRWYMGAAIVAGIGGIVLVAILTSLATNALRDRITVLRKGQSQVLEDGHTLILGWDEQRVVEIIKELAMANEKVATADRDKRSNVIVVLADQDKGDMDDHIRLYAPKTKPTRVVTRSGSQWSTVNLEIVSASTARSAIILSECNYAASDEKKEEADARVIKTLLALDSCVPSFGDLNVVVDLFRKKARTMSGYVGDGSVVALDVKTVLAGILLQTSRSVGLSVVYDELFSFRGAELYLKDVKGNDHESLEGLPFHEASDRLLAGVAVGVTRGRNYDAARCNGIDRVVFNPDPRYVLECADQLIVVAEDDSDIRFAEDSSETPELPQVASDPEDLKVERLLLIGWGPKTSRLLNEYGNYVDPRSTVDAIGRSYDGTDPAKANGDLEMMVERDYRARFKVSVRGDHPTEPSAWDAVDPLGYDSIIILSDGDRQSPADVVDAKTITILLLLRNAIESRAEEGDERKVTVVTELVESDNQVIAPDVGVHDFVISSRIVSMLFAELSEDPNLQEVYTSLFRAAGSEIYIKPIDRYIVIPTDETRPASFADLMRAANARDEICIGVKINRYEGDAEKNHGVQLIPKSDTSFELVNGDSLVVIARHDTEAPLPS